MEEREVFKDVDTVTGIEKTFQERKDGDFDVIVRDDIGIITVSVMSMEEIQLDKLNNPK